MPIVYIIRIGRHGVVLGHTKCVKSARTTGSIATPDAVNGRAVIVVEFPLTTIGVDGLYRLHVLAFGTTLPKQYLTCMCGKLLETGNMWTLVEPLKVPPRTVIAHTLASSQSKRRADANVAGARKFTSSGCE